jgi:hypothetical protein
MVWIVAAVKKSAATLPRASAATGFVVHHTYCGSREKNFFTGDILSHGSLVMRMNG